MRQTSSVAGGVFVAAALLFSSALPGKAINVVLSGTNNLALEEWLNANFSNITTLNSGDYSNFVNTPAQQGDIDNADVVIIGRILSSVAYGDVARAAAFNALPVPLVSFTSYVTRPDGNRLGWESGGTNGSAAVSGLETTLTAAGAGVFGGTAGNAIDWYGGDALFNAAGTGTVGGGEILATLGGNILSAHWAPGTASAAGVIFPDDRFLFNLQDAGGLVLPNAEGQAALIRALEAYTPLVAIPEPSTTLTGLAALGLLGMRRRRSQSA